MNIPAINTVIFPKNLQYATKKVKNESGSNFGMYMQQPLKKDAVSFGARYLPTLADFYGKSIEESNSSLKSAAYRFLDTVSAVVSTIAQKNTKISAMPNDMAKKFVLKSGQSAQSKALRSGTLDLTDRIRTTVYVQDLYDLSTLYKFIDEMALRGYKLAKTEEPAQKMLAKGCKLTKSEIEKGTVKVNDISVRLCDDTIKNAIPETSFAIDGRQKSGYEDIQLRFMNGKNKFETIMLFGPNYAAAKHMESEKVRKFTREFDTLAIKKAHTSNTLSPEQKAIVEQDLGKIKFYINSIQGSFYDHVTRPLYHWAKGIDYYGMEELKETAPNYTEIDYATFNRDFYNLKSKLKQCYDYMLNIASDDAKPELMQSRTNDIKIINKVRKGLENTGTDLGVLKIPPQKDVQIK